LKHSGVGFIGFGTGSRDTQKTQHGIETI